MKNLRKIVLTSFLIAGFASLALGIGACSGGEAKDGLSAYQLYLQEYADKNNGSTDGALSLEDWLLSLKGEDGLTGAAGEDVNWSCG